MTRIPTATAARHLFDQLRALNGNKDGTVSLKSSRLVDVLEQRMLTALERDRSGTVTVDGWPTSTTGNGGSGTPTSSVEAAVINLVDHPAPRDRHRELVVRATQALEDAVVALNVMRSALYSISDLTKTSVDPKTERTCAHCTNKRGTGNDRPVYATSTVADRLEQAVALCSPCWHFVEQTAKPGTRGGYLPSDEQIRDHEQRGRWRIRVAS